MHLPLYIGLRYTRAKRKNHFISFISMISMGGIALGVMTVIVVIGVMNGFDKELRARLLSTVSHATISAYSGETMPDWQTAVDNSLSHPEVAGAAPYLDTEAMLQGLRTEGGALRGIVPSLEATVTEFQAHMRYGELVSLQAGEFNIVLGTELAAVLGVGPGDQVTVYVPEFRTTAVGITPRLKRFTVTGLFEVGMFEFDARLALVHLNDVQKLLRAGDNVEGIRLKLDDMMRAPAVSRELGLSFDTYYRVRDWTQQNVNFFKATKTERMVMFIILSMIVAVAAFNILSTLVMLVTEKQSDVAILRTLGMSAGQVMLIFMVSGTLIGLIGTVLGTLGGLLISVNIEGIVGWLEGFFQTEFLSKEVYYISEITSDLHTADVVSIVVVAFSLSILATLYPAWRASRVQPAEALRYE